MRITTVRQDEPKHQTHEVIHEAKTGIVATGVTSYYHDGAYTLSVYLDDADNPERFELIGVYAGTPHGQTQCKNTSGIVRRVLEAIDALREDAQ